MKSDFEKMGGTYSQVGDYLLPNLTLPEQDERPIGIWGQRRRRYLKEHHRGIYYNLLTSCKLHDYLADINEEAEAMEDWLIEQYKEREGITEQLKAEDQMAWVGAMNNIMAQVREVIYAELICPEEHTE